MAHDVFISYSSEDENVVRAVSNALEANKIRCWYASRDIPTGADWPTSIVNAIQEAQALLLIFTDFANASEHVLREVTTAISEGKTLIPFKLTSNGPTEGMKYFLNTVHWLDAVDEPLEEAIDKLVDRVKKFVVVASDEDTGDDGIPDNIISIEPPVRKTKDLKIDPPPPPPPPSPVPWLKWLICFLAVALLVLGIIRFWPEHSLLSKISLLTGNWEKNALMADVLTTDGNNAEENQSTASDSGVFKLGIKRSEVETVTFKASMEGAPKAALDISDAVNGSVKGWFEKNNNGFYDLYIAGNGGVLAPEDCSGLFAGYINLKSIDFGNAFHTDATKNMRQMFEFCPNLNKLDLSGFNTSKVKNMSRMFHGDSGLRGITFGENFDTSGVELMYSMFRECKSLKILDVSRFDTSAVTTMRSMFYSCSGLTSLDVTGFKTGNVTDMSYMFYDCSNLKALDVSQFDTSAVTTMKSMFYSCSGLTSLDVTGFKTGNVTDMSHMFYDCSNLKALDVSQFDTSAVTTMKSMFYSCSGLTSLDISEFHTEKVTDMSYMFYNCSSLTALDVSNFDTEKVTACEYFMPDSLNPDWQKMFKSGTAQTQTTSRPILMEDIYITSKEKDEAASVAAFTTGLKRSEIETISFLNSLSDKPESAFDVSAEKDGSVMAWTNKNENGLYDLYIAGEGGVYAPRDCSGLFNGYVNLKAIDFNGNFHTENAENFQQLFFCCPSLSELNLSEFDSSKVTAMDGMFCHSVGLKEIIFGSKFDTSGVTNMTSMFFGCEELLQLDVSGFNTESCTSMHAMFHDCKALEKLDVSGFRTSKVKFMSSMFRGCSGLTALDVSQFDTSAVTTMRSMFYSCSSLTSLDVSKFNTENVMDMSCMFYGCSKLTTLDVSGFKTGNVTDMSCMFYDCSALTSLDISGFKTGNVTDMSWMFNKCSSLTALDVSKFNTISVTSMKCMFVSCSALTSLDVSGFKTGNVTDMSHMFYGCSNLKALDVSNFDTEKVTACEGFMPDSLNPDWRSLFPKT